MINKMDIYLNNPLVSKCLLATKAKNIRKAISIEEISSLELKAIENTLREILYDTEITKKVRLYWTMIILEGAQRLRHEKLNILYERANSLLHSEQLKKRTRPESAISIEDIPKTPEMPKLHFPLTPPDEHLLNEQQDDLLRNIPNGRSSPVEKELNLKEMMLAFEKYCEGDRTREYVTTARNITETEEIAIPENIPVSDLVPDTPTKRPASFVRHDDTPSKRRKMSSMVTDQIEAETEGPTEDNMEINEPILQRMDDNETVTDQRLDENVAGEIDVNEAFPPSPVAHEREADRQIEEKIPRVENIQVPEAQRLSQISEPEGPEIPAPKPRFKLTKVTANKMVQLSAQLTYQQKLEFQIRKHDQDILPSIHQPLSILERTEEELTRNENTLDLFDEIFYNTYFRLEVRSKVDERVQEPRDDAVLELENQEHDRRISRAPIEADISDVNNTDSRIANPQELSERSTLGHTIQIPNILVNDQPIEDVLEPILESNVEPAADPPFHSVVEPTLDQAQEATCNPTLQSPSQFRLQISRVYEADSYAAFFENLSFSEGEIVELDVIIPPESHNKLSLVRCLYCLLEFQKEKKILLSQDTCYGPILIRKWPIIE